MKIDKVSYIPNSNSFFDAVLIYTSKRAFAKGFLDLF